MILSRSFVKIIFIFGGGILVGQSLKLDIISIIMGCVGVFMLIVGGSLSGNRYG